MSSESAAPGDILTVLSIPRTSGPSMVRIASSFAYVDADVRVSDVYRAMSDDESVQAIGVVERSGAVVGILVRRDFFATMARPYAQDVFRHHPVREVMTEVRAFSADSDLFAVAEEIKRDLREPVVSYYLLTTSEGRFSGVFSSQDMLVYLSEITQTDITMARNLQARIVRDREISVGKRLELVAASQIAKGVGGDFYKVARYDDHRWMIALCDVSGKGVAASVITSVLWGMMSVYDFNRGLLPFVRDVNRYLFRTFETERFVTAILMDYDEESGVISLCDLGHSHLMVYREGRLSTVKTGQNNLPLGILPELEPRIDTFRPRPSDLLLMITDGLIEQPNIAGEIYSYSRIAQVIADVADSPVEVISDHLASDFSRFRGKRPLTDDVTWALMRFAPQEVTL